MSLVVLAGTGWNAPQRFGLKLRFCAATLHLKMSSDESDGGLASLANSSVRSSGLGGLDVSDDDDNYNDDGPVPLVIRFRRALAGTAGGGGNPGFNSWGG